MKLRQAGRRLWLAACFGGFVAIASGATYTWTGGGANGNFTNPANWLGGVVPPTDGTATILFANINHGPAAFVDAPFDLNAINFSGILPSTSTYAGSGAAVTLENGISVSTSNSPTINLTFPLVLANDQIWAIATGTLKVSGGISGAAQLTKTGAGTLALSSANTYSGGTVLSAGTLSLGNAAALGTGALAINGGTLNATATLTVANNVNVNAPFTFSGSALTLTGTVALLSGATITVSGSSFTLSGIVTGSQALTTAGSGSLFLSGTNTYTGGTVATVGEIIFVNAGALPAVGLLKSTGTGYIGTEFNTGVPLGFLAKFDAANTTGVIGFDSPGATQTYSEVINLTGFNSAASIGTSTAAILAGTITPQGSTFQFGGTGKLTVSSALVDGSGAKNVSVTDGLKLTLTGTNTYTGTTTVNNGALIFAGAGSLPMTGGLLTATAGGYIGYTSTTGLTVPQFLARFNAAATAGMIGFDSSTTGAIDLTGFNASATVGTSSTGIVLDGTVTPVGTSYRFASVKSGTLTITSLLTGARSVVIGTTADTTSSVTLTGLNTYTGGTTLQAGKLIASSTTALGTGTLTASGGTTLQVGITGFSLPGALVLGSGSVTYNTGTYSSTLAGLISGAGKLVFTDAGAGSVDVNSANTFTGGVLVGSTTVNLNNDTATGTGALDFNSNSGVANFTTSTPVVDGLTSSVPGATVTLANNATLTINETTSTRAAYQGSIQGSNVNLVKNGVGLTTLSGASAYTGTTTVNNGILLASNNTAFGTSSVAVSGGSLQVGYGVAIANPIAISNGSISGYGTFSTPGGVTVGNGAVLAPGTATTAFRLGLLSFSTGLTLGPSGTYQVDIQDPTGAAGIGYDSIAVTGALTFTSTIGSPLTLSLTSLSSSGATGALASFNNATTYSWIIANATSFVGYNPANITIDSSGFANALGGGAFSTSVSGSNLLVNFTPVPEPSTFALLALGLLPLAKIRRRKS